MRHFGRDKVTPETAERMRADFWNDPVEPPAPVPDTPYARRIYVRHSINHQVINDALAQMKDQDMTPGALAQELGTRKTRVDRVLAGDGLLTLDTVAALAAALRMDVEVRFVTPEEGVYETPAGSNNPLTAL